MEILVHYSDPKWNNSLIGRFFLVYKGIGKINLSKNSLILKSKKLNLEIKKRNIKKISIGHYHKTIKPFELNYINIEYKNEKKQIKNLFITPIENITKSVKTNVWNTNKYVEEIQNKIAKWKKS